MINMHLSLIVAHDENRIIGENGKMPWHLPSDLARFKRITMGKPVIMGRKTFESIGKVLPGRLNVVLTRRGNLDMEGVMIACSIDEALSIAEATGVEEAMVIGGEDVYAQTISLCSRIYITTVHTRVSGDASFPEFDMKYWKLMHEEKSDADKKNPHPQTFRIYELEKNYSGETRKKL